MLEEASGAEKKLVEDWLSANTANQQYYEHFKLIWVESSHLAPKQSPNENLAWDRFRQRINKDQPATPAKVRSLKSFFNVRSVAAIFILVVLTSVISYVTIQRSNDNQIVLSQTTNFTKTDTLPDGSIITLNRNSSIAYNKQFQTRDVQLTGEAFFSVTLDKEKPFIIKTEEAVVLVTGTSFNVNTTKGITQVIVETGSVQVATKRKKVVLRPGEQVEVHKNDTTLQTQKVPDQLHNYYRSKTFICNGTPLWRLAEMLTIAYGTRINIPDEHTRNLKLETTFNNASLDTIINIICKTFDLSAEKNGDSITLK
jgi:ferric-dicitrate binding protein FerR (iron transport regulator)